MLPWEGFIGSTLSPREKRIFLLGDASFPEDWRGEKRGTSLGEKEKNEVLSGGNCFRQRQIFPEREFWGEGGREKGTFGGHI